MDAAKPQPVAHADPTEHAPLRDALARTQARLDAALERIEQLQEEIAELKKRLPHADPASKIDEPFSLRAEEKRQEARGKKSRRPESKKQRRGRLANEEKLKRAERTEDLYPASVPRDQCQLSHVRVVWRLTQGGQGGQATRVAYRIFRAGKQYGIIPGVLGRSEFGLEIVVTLAQLIYGIGLSFDKACLVMGFLQNVKLSKSQADALLRQLSHHWNDEFEILCTLLANSLVVHADETSWSINSVWAFLSEKARLLFFGVRKDAATLAEILDPDQFQGLVFSDDAAVYAYFNHAQKCWAHLLRKAIKLTLQDPAKACYREFADQLLAIFHKANRSRRDQRLSDAGRARKVEELSDKLYELCDPVLGETALPGPLGHERCLLALEILRLMDKDELFTFVTAKAVEQPNGESKKIDGTNNEAERTLRDRATARKTGRTSKTISGARRTSILTSVLESLRLYLPTYTLGSVLEEVLRWQEDGKSCFRRLLEKLKLTIPDHSVLDRVLPNPSG
jgi:transposase